jgi:hypothetical protein
MGFRQEYGPCGVADADLSGYARTKFVCSAELDEDFHLGCVNQTLPPEHPSWYTICGKAHSHYPLYLGTVVALCTTASVVMARMLFFGAASMTKRD